MIEVRALTGDDLDWKRANLVRGWGGWTLALFIRDGVAASRAVKPSIPTVDQRAIPVRHELIFELNLDGDEDLPRA